MSSSLFESLRAETIPAFAAATQGARLNFYCNSSGKTQSECTEAAFDEFGAFEQIHADEQTLYVIERQHEENESEDETEDEDEEQVEQMMSIAIPHQRNSPAIMTAAKQEQPKKFEALQKTSPKAAAVTQPVKAANIADDTEAESGHARAATDPLSSAALSRMRYYRKLIPAPKSQNTSPKSEPHAPNHLPNSNNGAPQKVCFAFPPSNSTAALFYQPNNRSAPIAIPSKKSSPTNDDSHRFRTAVHPRIAADSSFVLPAASYLPSVLQKSFVPQGNDDKAREYSLNRDRGLAKASKGIVSVNIDEEQFGFEFEMDP